MNFASSFLFRCSGVPRLRLVTSQPPPPSPTRRLEGRKRLRTWTRTPPGAESSPPAPGPPRGLRPSVSIR